MSSPQVTIGLVVYNGEEYLAEAIQSFLDQSFQGFRLVIHDNASTDRTRQIADSIALRDSRVKVMSHAINIGAVMNFVKAAESADTPYFCWAAHDDVHHVDFLRTLVHALEQNPHAALAASGMMEINPDGSMRQPCLQTAALHSTMGMTDVSRLIHYMRTSPCSPIYGVFRTASLKMCLPILRKNAAIKGGVFGGDLVFLAGFWRRFNVIIDRAPLLLLRHGGQSHRANPQNGLWRLASDLWQFSQRLKNETDGYSGIDRIRVALARWRLLVRYIFWPPLWIPVWYQVSQSNPIVDWFRIRFQLLYGPFARLRRRFRAMKAPCRVVLFGAGKHTSRHLATIHEALRNNATVVAICDDRPKQSIDSVAIIRPEDLAGFSPDIVLVSSDTYEEILYQRARELVHPHCQVWRIYGDRQA